MKRKREIRRGMPWTSILVLLREALAVAPREMNPESWTSESRLSRPAVNQWLAIMKQHTLLLKPGSPPRISNTCSCVDMLLLLSTEEEKDHWRLALVRHLPGRMRSRLCKQTSLQRSPHSANVLLLTQARMFLGEHVSAVINCRTLHNGSLSSLDRQIEFGSRLSSAVAPPGPSSERSRWMRVFPTDAWTGRLITEMPPQSLLDEESHQKWWHVWGLTRSRAADLQSASCHFPCICTSLIQPQVFLHRRTSLSLCRLPSEMGNVVLHLPILFTLLSIACLAPRPAVSLSVHRSPLKTSTCRSSFMT